jgi:hypothetical protein
MEQIKYKLSNKKKQFLQNMQEYLDTKLYFYGSIQRMDYIDDVSDIDVCMFTDNMDSTLLHLTQYLNIDSNSIKKFYIKTKVTSLVNGYKINYKNPFIKLEICIYHNKNKENVLQEFINIIYIPYFYSFILLILKYINMILPIPYRTIKQKLINSYKKESNTYFFITLKNK